MDPQYADEKLVVKHIDSIEKLESQVDLSAERKLVRKME